MMQNSKLIKKHTVDILEIAGKFKPKKIISALKIRKKFEKTYKRV